MKPSKDQINVHDFIRKGKGNAVVRAAAGSGKTTTIVSGVKYLPQTDYALFLAFNKSIKNELRERLINYKNIYVFTLHSFGFNALKNHFKNKDIIIDNYKYKKLLNSIVLFHKGKPEELDKFNLSQDQLQNVYEIILNEDSPEFNEYCDRVFTLCDYLRYNFINYNSKEAEFQLEEIAENFCIPTEEGECQIALSLTKIGCFLPTLIDYVDMLYLPLILDVKTLEYKWIFIDECQDLNKAQRLLMLKALRSDGRFIAVGDPNQSIYAFAGADIQSYNALCNYPNTIQLPLSTTYRCAKNIVDLAQTIVPEIQAAENAIEGEININAKLSEIKDGDLVLCRLVFPIVCLCMQYLSRGIKAKIIGSDIGIQLKNLIEKQKRKREQYNMINVLSRLNQELNKRLEHIQKKYKVTLPSDARKYPYYSEFYEKILAISYIASGLDDPQEVIDKIQYIFSDENKDGILLSTVHKAKGLEAERVFIIHPDKLPLKHPKMKDWENEQEINLQYVAYTRAKSYLGFIPLSEFDAYRESDNKVNVDVNANSKLSKFLGTEGEYILIEGIIERIIDIETRFGPSNIFIIKTNDGSIVEKIGTIKDEYSREGEIQEGCTIKFHGLVKEHKEYKGKKSTLISLIKK